MSEETIRLAILGYPLAFTLSPELHRAGAAAVGVRAESLALPTPPESLGERLRELAAAGYRGCNVTHPLKERVLEFVHGVSFDGEFARSVNTLSAAGNGWTGLSTDGTGFREWLRTLGRQPGQERAVFLGGGGAARSLACFVGRAPAAGVVVSVRRPSVYRDLWKDMVWTRLVTWRSEREAEALREATLVVNATPLEDPEAIAPLAGVNPGALVVDLRYGPEVTAWVTRARSLGLAAHDGLGVLVHQGRQSLEWWLRRPVPLEPLMQAVGWPR